MHVWHFVCMSIIHTDTSLYPEAVLKRAVKEKKRLYQKHGKIAKAIFPSVVSVDRALHIEVQHFMKWIAAKPIH